jgi:hypothetical protein
VLGSDLGACQALYGEPLCPYALALLPARLDSVSSTKQQTRVVKELSAARHVAPPGCPCGSKGCWPMAP